MAVEEIIVESWKLPKKEYKKSMYMERHIDTPRLRTFLDTNKRTHTNMLSSHTLSTTTSNPLTYS